MTADLVSRLRQTAAAGYAGWDTARDAADEIERLRKGIDEVLRNHDDCICRFARRTLGKLIEKCTADDVPTVDPYTPRARKGPQGHPTAFEQAKQLEHSSDDVGAPRDAK